MAAKPHFAVVVIVIFLYILKINWLKIAGSNIQVKQGKLEAHLRPRNLKTRP
jgi:uncharacterized membrane protein (Fun14 family)